MEPKTVILVPRRSGYADRDALWKFCRAWWQQEFPELPIFEGHHDDGLFNRSAAVNLAARAATHAQPDWEVALIIDSDILCHPPNVRKAIALALESDVIVVPFDARHNLNQNGTKLIIGQRSRGSWKPYIDRTYLKQHSSVIAVSRTLWERSGGFDEEFRGWGYEDTAFWITCETLSGPLVTLPGEVWHLFHKAAPENYGQSISVATNQARLDQYKAIRGDAEAISVLRATPTFLAEIEIQPAQTRAPTQVTTVSSIPRILHRVVPRNTSEEVERWWGEFQKLHPGWLFMTHRDSLDPKDWPLVGSHLAKARNGAQVADLVRLEALYKFGGVYVDSDCEPYRPLDSLLGLQAFAAWEDYKVVCNAVMGAAPKHPAIKECIDLALKEMRKGTWQAGPGVTTRIFPGRADVLLFPPGSFYPYLYNEKHRREEDHKKNQPWSFMAHHWAGSWLANK